MADSNYASDSLLLPFDGTNGSTTIKDYSINNFSLTCTGSASISTTQSKYGGSSLYLNGGYVSRAADTKLVFGTGDFTIRVWIYPTSVPGAVQMIFDTRTSGGGSGICMFLNNSNKIQVFTSGSSVATSTASCSLNTWSHVEIARSGTSLKLFINGVVDQSITLSNNLAEGNCVIGKTNESAAGYFYGYIDDLNVTKGVARHTADFSSSLPTALVKSISGTVRNDTNTGTIRNIRACPRSLGYPLFETTSAADGSYTLRVPDVEHSVIVFDDDAGTLYNDIIMRVLPG